MAEEGTNSQGDTGADGNGTETSFLDGIQDEGIRGNEGLKDFDNLDSLAKGYVDLKASQPTIPENADGYQFDIPEGTEINQADFDLFKADSHKMGLSNEQYQGIIQFDFARQERADKVVEEKRETAITELKTELGDKYDESLDKAQKVLRAAGREDLSQDFELGNHPSLFRLLNWVGGKISEDQLESGGGGGTGDNRPTDETGKPILQYDNM